MSTQTRQVKHKPSTLARTHCPKGHEWTLENLRTLTNGVLRCRVCQAEQNKARSARVQAEHAALYQ